MQTIKMYDAADHTKLPGDAGVYAAYVNGEFANYRNVSAQFPRAKVFGIDVIGDAYLAASILDWETGNPCFTQEKLKEFVTGRETFMPHTACVYCDESNLPVAEAALKGLWHVIWLTTLDGRILTGKRTASGNLIVATQYAGGMTAPFDTSAVMEDWVKGKL